VAKYMTDKMLSLFLLISSLIISGHSSPLTFNLNENSSYTELHPPSDSIPLVSFIPDTFFDGPANQLEYPYHVTFRPCMEQEGYPHRSFPEVCGGAIISDNFIISSFSCLQKTRVFSSYSLIEVAIGVRNLTSGATGAVFPIQDVYPYPGFYGTSLHDLALIKVDGNLTQMTSDFKSEALQMEDKYIDRVGQEGIVTGFPYDFFDDDDGE